MTRLVAHPATALSTLLGGILIDLAGYGTVFVLSLAFPLAAFALTSRFRDPRSAVRPAVEYVPSAPEQASAPGQ